MSNERYSDDELRMRYGERGDGSAIFEPQELGYRCPKGHSHITWSEFKKHIWCFKCEKDYHYADDCVLVEDQYNPKDLDTQPRIIKGIKNWTDDGESFNDIPEKLLVLSPERTSNKTLLESNQSKIRTVKL